MRRRAIACAALALAAVAPASAQGAEIGQTAPPGESVGGCLAATQVATAPGTPTYTVPFDGEITTWRHQATAQVMPLRLQVFRQTKFTFPPEWLVVAQSRLETPVANQLNVFRTSIPVRAGDQLALSAGTTPGSHVVACHFLSRMGEDDLQTFPRTYSPGETAREEGPGIHHVRLNVSATVVDVCRNKHGKAKKPKWCSKRP